MATKKSQWKKKVAIGVSASVIALGFWASQAFYTVTQVIDGDTFVTKENRYVRLDSVNAPELGFCLGKEAKEKMEKLVMGKKVFLKVSFVDNYNRIVASVYTLDGNVGEKMLAAGLATFKDKGVLKGSTLGDTEAVARKAKIGIYSPICTQTENPTNRNCNIKGNVVDSGKFYHYPGCQSYATTIVQLYLGDKWFCTETEAKKAGFVKGADCN